MSEAILIKATDPTTKQSAEFAYDFGEAEDLIAAYGADVVLRNFVAASKVQAQNLMREMIRAGKSSDEIAAYMAAEWKPGVQTRDTTTTFINKVKGMTDEERLAMVELLRKELGL